MNILVEADIWRAVARRLQRTKRSKLEIVLDNAFPFVPLAITTGLVSLPFILLTTFVGRPEETLAIKLAGIGLFVLFWGAAVAVIMATVVLATWLDGDWDEPLDPWGIETVTVGELMPAPSRGARVGCALCPALRTPDSSGNWRHITMHNGWGVYVCPAHQGDNAQLVNTYLERR